MIFFKMELRFLHVQYGDLPETSHLLTCAVSSEVYTDPVTLDCYHNFCRKCAVTITKTQPAAITAKSLPYVMCRRLTKAVHCNEPVDWANNMKPRFISQGLFDSFGPGTKDSSHCNLCHEVGEIITAVACCSICDVSLCEGCLKGHRRNPASRHHVVSDLSGEDKVKRKRKFPCSEHKDEIIKFHCKSCKKTLCQTCCILYHRRCEDVVLLESVVPEMVSTLRRKRDILATKLQDTSVLLSKSKSNYDKIQTNKVSMQSQVRMTCQKIIDEVKKKEKRLIQEIDEVSEKQMGQVKAEIKSTEMSMQMYLQDTEMISKALASENEVDLYALYQSYESGNLETLDAVLKGTETHSRKQLRQNIDKLNKILEDLQLGETDVTCSSSRVESGLDKQADLDLGKTINKILEELQLDATDVTDTSSRVESGLGPEAALDLEKASNKILEKLQMGRADVTPISSTYNSSSVKSALDLEAALGLEETIDVTVAGDKTTAYPIEVTVLDVNGINTVVVTDQSNKSVKSFYTRNKQQCRSKMWLYSKPWGLTQLKHNQVAVTLPNAKQIVTFAVNPNLKGLSTITTQKEYRGISLLTPTTLAVSSVSPPCVDVLDMDGNVLKSVSPVKTTQNIINQAYFICTTTKGNILVSDCGTNSVLCLTPEGDVVFNYSPTGDRALRIPYGVTVISTGDILVTDYSICSVVHLTESGQFVRNILTSQHGVLYPRGICLDKHGCLYVTQAHGCIKVFKASK